MNAPLPVAITVDTPEKLSALLTFCTEQGIQYVAPDHPFREIVLDTIPHKPTPEFKLLCGNEWLERGCVTTRSVYEFVNDYARINKILKPDGSIQMNDPLQEAFKSSRRKIYPCDIPELAKNVFESV